MNTIPLPDPEKIATWHSDMKRGKHDYQYDRFIRIQVPVDIDEPECEFLDEYWKIVRSTINTFCRKRLTRKAVAGDVGFQKLRTGDSHSG